MKRRTGVLLRRCLDRWTSVVARSPGLVLVVAVILATAAAVHTVRHLRINTDTADLISPELPFRRDYDEYKRAFPQHVDTLLAVIEATAAEVADDAANTLVRRLRERTDLFVDAYVIGGGDYLTRHGLLYLSESELETLADDLARVQPLLVTLAMSPHLNTFVGLLQRAGETEVDTDPLRRHFAEVVDALVEGRPCAMSWRSLIEGDDRDGVMHRRLVVVQAHLNFDRLFPAAPALDAIRHLIDDEEPALQEVDIHLTGTVALAHDELASVSRGAATATLLALVLVALALWTGLRSMRLILATVLTLLLGLALTAGFATVAVGELNMISIAFAVLYIGLGVDYAIHLCLRYRELVARGHEPAIALRVAIRNVGSTLVLCAVSTAIGFYAFMPTTFTGVSQLGLIGGTGMFVSLLVTLSVLPATLCLLPVRMVPVPTESRARRHITELPGRLRVALRWLALVMVLASLWFLRGVTFDYDPINLHDPQSESVLSLRRLVAADSLSLWAINVLAQDEDEARRLAADLRALPSVGDAVTIHNFVPEGQSEKLEFIDGLAIVLGAPSLVPSSPSPPAWQEQVNALRSFRDTLALEPDSTNDARLGGALDEFLSVVEGHDDAPGLINELEKRLLGTLPAALERLELSLSAAPFAVEDLPGPIRERWISATEQYRIEVIPNDDVSDASCLRRFVQEVTSIAPGATDRPVIVLASGDAVIVAFKQAFASALIVIAVLLVTLRGFREASLILLALVLGGMLMGAASTVLDVPFNFANIIALPLLLGVGVDSGIHVVHRLHWRGGPPESLLRTSTARAVVFSSLTTVLGFGTLILSPHHGTASMGTMLTLGVAFLLMTTLLFLPAFMLIDRSSQDESSC